MQRPLYQATQAEIVICEHRPLHSGVAPLAAPKKHSKQWRAWLEAYSARNGPTQLSNRECHECHECHVSKGHLCRRYVAQKRNQTSELDLVHLMPLSLAKGVLTVCFPLPRRKRAKVSLGPLRCGQDSFSFRPTRSMNAFLRARPDLWQANIHFAPQRAELLFLSPRSQALASTLSWPSPCHAKRPQQTRKAETRTTRRFHRYRPK